jgi:hypothetical protein
MEDEQRTFMSGLLGDLRELTSNQSSNQNDVTRPVYQHGAAKEVASLYQQMITIANKLNDPMMIQYRHQHGFQLTNGLMNQMAQGNNFQLSPLHLPASVNANTASSVVGISTNSNNTESDTD